MYKREAQLYEIEEEVCEVDITPVGCYNENTNNLTLQEVFYNEADPGRPNFAGSLLQWSNDFVADFEKFLCKCAHLARSRRWEYFGVREIGKSKAGGVLPISKIQLAVYYQCCVVIG